MLRKATCFFLICLLPSILLAQGETAVLYGTGAVYLNGAQLSNSAAVTNGDVIQTKDTGAANLNSNGTSIVIQSNTIVRFQPGGIALDRGSVSIATGKGMSVYARDFKITPTGNGWTEFYVSRSGGVIQIIARKNDVTVNCGAGSSTVKESQQLSRDDADNCGLIGKSGAGAPSAAKGPILNSGWTRDAGLAAGGGLLIWVLTRCEDAVSPSTPGNHCVD